MPSTPRTALPYPASTAADNVPLDLQLLAERVEAKMVGHVGTAYQELHFEVIASGNTDGSGFRVMPHTAGWAPRGVFLINTGPGSSWATFFGFDTPTTTTFRARFMHAGVGGSYNSAATGPMFAILVK